MKKKSGKDSAVFGVEADEPGSGRGVAAKDSARKESEASSAQGLPARRPSMKQNFFATYYQEKAAAEANMPEVPYGSSTSHPLPYEPVPLAP